MPLAFTQEDFFVSSIFDPLSADYQLRIRQYCREVKTGNNISLLQFTVTKVDEDEQDCARETPEQKNKNKNGPVSQFHLLQVRHEKAILLSKFLIRFCLDITFNCRHDTEQF